MYPIFPSILAFDFARLAEQVAAVETAGAAGLHFDIMDNHFVPNLTFGPLVVAAVRPHTALPIWAHLMVYHPETLIEPLAKAGAQRLYLHPESSPHINRLLTQVREAGMEVGVSINPGTPMVTLEPILDMVDGVLVMSVNPGFGGQEFLPVTYRRLRELQALLQKFGFKPSVECDGGVDGETIGPLAASGMTGAVIGTALFRDGDPGTTLRRFAELADR